MIVEQDTVRTLAVAQGPAAGETRLAKRHFWTHNITLPLQVGTLAMYLNGNNSIEPVLAFASIVMGVGLVCFAINLWKHTGV